MTDLFDPLTPPNPAAPKPRSCTHPRHMRRLFEGGTACGRCGKEILTETSRRGRTSRRRGNDIERSVGKQLGLRRVGQYGGTTTLAMPQSRSASASSQARATSRSGTGISSSGRR